MGPNSVSPTNFEHLTSKKSIINFFGSNSDKVKKYIKDQKLKTSEISSLIEIFKFADNL